MSLSASAEPVDAPSHVAALTKGWKIEQLAKGDLNGDGLEDFAALLTREPRAETPAAGAATLRIFFGKPDGALSPTLEAPHAVCVDCGGIKGGSFPFSADIRKGIFLLEHHGGSREMFTVLTKWRFQKEKFFLIGVIAAVSDTANGYIENTVPQVRREANISTLQMTETVTDEVQAKPDGTANKRSGLKECRVPEFYKNVTLDSFAIEEFEAPACSVTSLD